MSYLGDLYLCSVLYIVSDHTKIIMYLYDVHDALELLR